MSQRPVRLQEDHIVYIDTQKKTNPEGEGGGTNFRGVSSFPLDTFAAQTWYSRDSAASDVTASNCIFRPTVPYLDGGGLGGAVDAVPCPAHGNRVQFEGLFECREVDLFHDLM